MSTSKNKTYTPTERLGVNKVEGVFLEIGWIPRTVYQTDVGIDMTVEVANDGNPTGQYIAVQIKTGESYFKEKSIGDVIYRGESRHLEYWLNHSMPVIIVLCDISNETIIWQEINEDKIVKTPKAWKIEIPENQLLTVDSKEDLLKVNKLPIAFQRFQRLASNKSLMLYIKNGGELILEIVEYTSKSSQKANIKVVKHINEEDIVISETNYWHFRSPTSLNILFPWANFEIDEDYYEKIEREEFNISYGIWDSEEGRYVGTYINFEEYMSGLPKIRPVGGDNGETAFYRLCFKLNGLSDSFLTINEYMEYGIQLKLF